MTCFKAYIKALFFFPRHFGKIPDPLYVHTHVFKLMIILFSDELQLVQQPPLK